MNKIIILVVSVAVASLVLLFGLGLFSSGDSGSRGHGRFRAGDFQDRPGFGNMTDRFKEFENNTEVQALLAEMREARQAGDEERVQEIFDELEGLGLNMSRMGQRPDGTGPFIPPGAN
jgi:hypothetical protein